MLKLIVEFAEADERIRVALMTGSRVDPAASPDPFQDYDIVYLVTEVEPFRNRNHVLSGFGPTLVVEEPLLGPWPPDDADEDYHNYNVQFVDGNRIDMVFRPVDQLPEEQGNSSLIVLSDKDGRVPMLPPPSRLSYAPTPPSESLYAGCCTGFFFTLSSHIPKTLWRRQLPLLKFYVEVCLRDALLLMLQWDIGIRTDWSESIGKKGKDLETHLPPKMWEAYWRTYAGHDYGDLWDSLFIFHDLFRRSAQSVARRLGFSFPSEQSEGALRLLQHVRSLPEGARSIY